MGITASVVTPPLARELAKVSFLLILLFVLIGTLAPWIDGGHWREPVQRHLETLLGRKVEFEGVHYTLFSGPGLTLENVTIGEDPRYGQEPFAFVPHMRVRLRLDRLLLGDMRVSSLRLEDPSLNLVKRSGEGWSVLELVRRLVAPRRSPFNLFPVLEVTGGRVDFKLGVRKTTLYLLDTDFSIYPQRSGKLFVEFTGSPARTDRAGNGFGRVRGRFNWFLDASGALDRLQADLNLYPSNLSELATLVEGHDIGVHGTVSTHLVAEGKLDNLAVRAAVQFGDVHRWDLMPASGDVWTIRIAGTADLNRQQLTLTTTDQPDTPVSLNLQVADFLTRPDWSLAARLQNVPAANLLPVCRRMGVEIPERLSLAGSVAGQLFLTRSGGLTGDATLSAADATLPDSPALHADLVHVQLQEDRLRFDPAALRTSSSGTLEVGGDIFLLSPKAGLSIGVQNVPAVDLKKAVAAWFRLPVSVEALRDGTMSGQLSYRRDPDHVPDADGSWSGHFQFADATLHLPGVAVPLERAEGRVAFGTDTLEVSHFSALAGKRKVRATYRYNGAARRPERLHLTLEAADLEELQSMLAPTLEPQSWLARLRVARRSVPAWITARDMDGDMVIDRFLVDNHSLGPLMCRFVWRGASFQIPSVVLKLPTGQISAQGTVGFESYSPQYAFTAEVHDFAWRGGTVDAQGTFETTGTGADLLRHLQANGTFSAGNLALSSDALFSTLAGAFQFSFADGWPNLHLSQVQGEDGENSWSGQGTTESDGKLILDLEHAGQQRRIISSLEPASPPAVSLADEH